MRQFRTSKDTADQICQVITANGGKVTAVVPTQPLIVKRTDKVYDELTGLPKQQVVTVAAVDKEGRNIFKDGEQVMQKRSIPVMQTKEVVANSKELAYVTLQWEGGFSPTQLKAFLKSQQATA